MSEVTLFQTGFRMDDSALQPGDIFRKGDGTVWLVNPDDSQSQITGGGGGGGFAGWTENGDPADVASNGGSLTLLGTDGHVNLILKDGPGQFGDNALLYFQDNDGNVLAEFYDGILTFFADQIRQDGNNTPYQVQSQSPLTLGSASLGTEGSGFEAAVANPVLSNQANAPLYATGGAGQASVTFDFGGGVELEILAYTPGSVGNDFSSELLDPGVPSQSLSLAITDSGQRLSISLATDGGGAITSQVSDIVAAVNDPSSPAFDQFFAGQPSNDGTVSAESSQPLAGGADNINTGGPGTWGVAADGSEYKFAGPAPTDASVSTSEVKDFFDDALGYPKALFKARDSAGTLFAGILAVLSMTNVFKLRNISATDAAAALDPSQYTTWLDDSAGAPVFHIVAQDSAGTPFGASIPLGAL